jgi:hypothetical protein
MACGLSEVVYIQQHEVRETLTNMREYLAIGRAIGTFVSALRGTLMRVVR